MEYYIKKKSKLGYEQSLEKVKVELEKEGFGILTTIDVKETIKEKLNLNYDKYMILGICNPNIAIKFLDYQKDLGVFLPCNVIIYEKKGETFISIFEPLIILSLLDDNVLEEYIKEIRTKLKNILSSFN